MGVDLQLLQRPASFPGAKLKLNSLWSADKSSGEAFSFHGGETSIQGAGKPSRSQHLLKAAKIQDLAIILKHLHIYVKPHKVLDE